MIRRAKRCGERLVMWWNLTGQFSRPVRLVSPRRRVAHAAAEAMFAEPGYREASLARVAAAVQRRRAGREAVAVLSEAELFRRIFGQDMAEVPPGKL